MWTIKRLDKQSDPTSTPDLSTVVGRPVFSSNTRRQVIPSRNFNSKRGVMCCKHKEEAHQNGVCLAQIVVTKYSGYQSANVLQYTYPCRCKHLVLEHRLKGDKRKRLPE